MVRLLKAHHIMIVRSRRAFYVPLSAIKQKMQPLWKGMCASEEGRRLRAGDPLQ
jgi:hypothetical protein